MENHFLDFLLYQVSQGDLQKAEWIEWHVPYVDVFKWLCLRIYLNRKETEALSE